MTDHPITPPPELVEDWIELTKPLPQRPPNPGELATLAARWGSDQELEACCEWFKEEGWNSCHPEALRTARRPRSPSLKEQALATLQKLSTSGYPCNLQQDEDWDTIRQALEQLDD